MFSQGDVIRDRETGAEAVFQYRYDADWPKLYAVASWPREVDGVVLVVPGQRGVPYGRCELVRRKGEAPRV